MGRRCAAVIGLSLLLCSAAQEEPATTTQEDQLYDGLGRVDIASAFARPGAFCPIGGNPGFTLDVRNWDPEKHVSELRGQVGFAGSTRCRIKKLQARVRDGRSFGKVVIYPNGCQFRIEEMRLAPGETVELWVTLTSSPPDGYAIALEAEY